MTLVTRVTKVTFCLPSPTGRCPCTINSLRLWQSNVCASDDNDLTYIAPGPARKMLLNCLFLLDFHLFVQSRIFSGTAIASNLQSTCIFWLGIMQKPGLCVWSRTFDNHLGTIFCRQSTCLVLQLVQGRTSNKTDF